MEKDLNKLCACKGIRSCLACEKDKGIQNCGPFSDEEHLLEYTFCHSCRLCWPCVRVNAYNEFSNFGFFLPGILLIHDFINKEEERQVVSNIDQISWVPSQSGRRKQDFGPKVNFKKHKVKVGEFNGFPEFTDFIIERLGTVRPLSSFLPVELCNLEYCPERGAHIEPHVDDTWLWGERLITLNLLSSSTLTLTPVDASERRSYRTSATNLGYVSNAYFMDHECENLDENRPSVSVIGSHRNPLQSDLSNGICTCVTDYCDLPTESHQKISDLNSVETVICTEKESSIRNSKYKLKRIVRIPLPPRSLLVLYGCARYHWFHAIRRHDIKDRRLAMTFRELSFEFLPGGSQSECGKMLLDVAKIQGKS